jgi:prepilin-type N-terminal cleavage/methylation domain-containing protein
MNANRPLPGTRRCRPRGFTLIELMVAMAILAVVLLLSSEVTTSTRNSIRWSEKRLTADAEARRVFALLDRDLGALVVRPDAPLEFKAQTGNDQLVFLAARTGFDPAGGAAARELSWIEYAPQSDGLSWRGCLGFGFGDDDIGKWSRDGTAAPPAIPAANRQVVSNAVVRMEIELLVRDGSTVKRTQAAADVQQVQAEPDLLEGVVVTVAAVEPRSLRTLGDQGAGGIAGMLDDAGGGDDLLATWNRKLEQEAGNASPEAAVARATRVYQQTYLIN